MNQTVEDIINEINETQIHEGRTLMLYEMRPIMEKHIANITQDNKEDEQMSVIDGKVVTGRRMSDGEPVTGFIIGTTPFTYILPEDEVRKACCTGQQQVKIEITAERILAHD